MKDLALPVWQTELVFYRSFQTNQVTPGPVEMNRHVSRQSKSKSKAVPLHAMEALGGRGGIAPTHSRPRH